MGITRHATARMFSWGSGRWRTIRCIANPSNASTVPCNLAGGAESPISAVPRTLDFTSTRHRVAHSERLDFTSEKFGLYQRARLPINQAESMVYRSYPLDFSSAS
jgi:hypothetical protein